MATPNQRRRQGEGNEPHGKPQGVQHEADVEAKNHTSVHRTLVERAAEHRRDQACGKRDDDRQQSEADQHEPGAEIGFGRYRNSHAGPAFRLRQLTRNAMMAAASHTPSITWPGGTREIGIPERAEIEDGLAPFLAIDRTGNGAVEIDSQPKSWQTVGFHGDHVGQNATRAMRNSKMPKMARARRLSVPALDRTAPRGDQRERRGGSSRPS